MKIAILICCILALALLVSLGLSYTPGISSEISVTEVDNGVTIENGGNVACLVFVSSLEDEQQFALAAGENITVTDISQPVQVSAVSPTTISQEDWENFVKAMERIGKYKLSSNFTKISRFPYHVQLDIIVAIPAVVFIPMVLSIITKLVHTTYCPF
jgi:predicted protein tyrosine phosphatase